MLRPWRVIVGSDGYFAALGARTCVPVQHQVAVSALRAVFEHQMALQQRE